MNPGVHEVLRAFGPQASHIAQEWNIYLLVCGVVFACVLAALLLALKRAPRAGSAEPPDLSTVNRPEPGPRRTVATATTIVILLLLVLLTASVFTDRAIARLSLKNAVNIELTAHQWWWTVHYNDGPVSQTFDTANEIHVPVGRPVIVTLHADDVIHSLWLPNLAGKRDLIPGRTSTVEFQADQPGIYRGQCAEFCGFQHAYMGIEVQAQPEAQYQQWRQLQLQPASVPSDPQAKHGMELFQSVSCAMCHTVQGTLAQGKRAPDLTHVASRRTLAAGTLPMTPENLAAWVADPQRIKPGVNMPATPLSNADLAAIVAYLGTLK